MTKIDLLVVEDNPIFVDILRHRLAIEDINSEFYIYNLSSVNSFAELHKELEVNDYDMVLLDLQLSDIHWTDTIDYYTKFFKTPFCIMSALPATAYALTSLRKGAQDYFCKSDRRMNIKERLAFALARSKQDKC